MSPEEISSRRLSCARVPTLPSRSSTTCRLNAAENFLLSAMFRSFLLHRHSNLWRKTVQCQGVSPPIGINMYEYRIASLKKEGAKIDWVALEPVVSILEVVAITSTAAHPNAAKLLADFMLSVDGQNLIRGFG